MSRILQQLDKFLDEHHKPGLPILIGFSGGPDSTALLFGLYLLQRKHDLQVIAVHIDHCWREESGVEAALLQETIKKLGLKCVVHRLLQQDSYNNREEKARDARLSVFRQIYEEVKAQALVLAHQAGDQAETALKRIFEGGHISSLGGMRKSSILEEMVVWRPLLDIPKRELICFCEERKLSFLQDATNLDERYLRARMRTTILPLLENQFGKSIEENLCRLADSSKELFDYLEFKTQGILKKCQITETTISIDLSECHPLESQFAIKQLVQNEGVVLGQQHLRQLAGLLSKSRGKYTFHKGNLHIIVERGTLRITRLTNTEDTQESVLQISSLL